tara:strand:- start:228 stop:419 length:192 start_codon:yes stop_codon:yes gene_type:complete
MCTWWVGNNGHSSTKGNALTSQEGAPESGGFALTRRDFTNGHLKNTLTGCNDKAILRPYFCRR